MSSWHIGLSVVATDVGGGSQWRRTRFYNGEYPVLGCYLQDAWCLVKCSISDSES
jgi:hypothetical protein